jgi:hypothetical protein
MSHLRHPSAAAAPGTPRRRQSVAPGVSPGIQAAKNNKPSKRATGMSVAPTGLLDLGRCTFPGLTPGAINMPPANAGSLSMVTFDVSNRFVFFCGKLPFEHDS